MWDVAVVVLFLKGCFDVCGGKKAALDKSSPRQQPSKMKFEVAQLRVEIVRSARGNCRTTGKIKRQKKDKRKNTSLASQRHEQEKTGTRRGEKRQRPLKIRHNQLHRAFR
jgi:hypothetical protein